MELLQTIRASEASADYLYARVRSRRFQLDRGGMGTRRSSVGPMQELREEYLWVYRSLNRRLRRKLLPVFEYEELRHLILALRYLSVQDRSALKDVLTGSLINRTICKAVTDAEKVSTAVAALERLLNSDYPFSRNLTEVYLRQGPGGVEQALNSGFLMTAVAAAQPEVIKTYFRYLIDMRNLLALYKHLHWQLPIQPPVVEGGGVGKGEIKKCWNEQSLDGVEQLVRRVTGLPGRQLKAGLEENLCRGLAEKLKKAGRDPLQIGVLLDYLWRCRIVARQRGVRMHLSQGGGEHSELEFGV